MKIEWDQRILAPAKGLFVWTRETEQGAFVTISDLSDHVIQELLLSEKLLKIGGLKPGIYRIEVRQNENEVIQKLIIEE